MWWDDVATFGVRVNQKSTTFVIKQANRYHVFGRYPIVSLKQAREEAKRRLALKYFPQQSIKAQEAIALYLEAKRSELRPSSLKNFTGALRQFPAKNLGEVTTLDIAQALRPLPPSNANLCQAIFKAFLNWCVDKGHISSNPIAAQKRPHKTKSRDRLLTDDEIKAIWLASYRYADFGTLCRALILSGQRLNQFNSFQHSWIENNVIVFPASIMKGKEAHTLPLTGNLRANMSIGAGYSPLVLPHPPMQIMRKGGDAAAPRKVIADERNTTEWFH